MTSLRGDRHEIAVQIEVVVLAAGSGETRAGGFADAGRSLFQSFGYASLTSATASTDPVAGKLLASPSSAGLQLVQVDADAVSAGQLQLQFELQEQTVHATQAKVEQLSSGDRVWYGNLGDVGARATTLSGIDPLNSLILRRSGASVTGTIRHAGSLYRLRPVGQGRHALVEVDERRMPADHPAAHDWLPTITMPAGDRIGTAAASSGEAATIRVLVVATDAAVVSYGEDLQPLAELAVAESDQAPPPMSR